VSELSFPIYSIRIARGNLSLDIHVEILQEITRFGTRPSKPSQLGGLNRAERLANVYVYIPCRAYPIQRPTQVASSPM
jgi:hypothetical protein